MTRPTVNRLQKIDIRQHRGLAANAKAVQITINGVMQIVRVIATPCNYGGFRYWFACPNCLRKCCVIYHAKSGLACRLCYRLCYPIENQTKSDRAITQAWKMRRKLGWNYGGVGEMGKRPKNMQQRTFEKLVKRECDYAEMFYSSIALYLNRTFKLIGTPHNG